MFKKNLKFSACKMNLTPIFFYFDEIDDKARDNFGLFIGNAM